LHTEGDGLAELVETVEVLKVLEVSLEMIVIVNVELESSDEVVELVTEATLDDSIDTEVLELDRVSDDAAVVLGDSVEIAVMDVSVLEEDTDDVVVNTVSEEVFDTSDVEELLLEVSVLGMVVVVLVDELALLVVLVKDDSVVDDDSVVEDDS
jgi:hypothetical protein